MLISVCVATYQRPEGLKRLLDGLNKLTFSKCETPNLEVIVVDNNSTGSASSAYYEKVNDFKWSLKYCIEPIRGISYARNRAIASVSKEANFVAFIDDDEVPEPSWLDELLFVQQKYNADVVTGPVLPHFVDEDVPDWVVKGKFFEPNRYPTGSLRHVAFTNNVLVRFEVLSKIEKIFDERFALTGGEDSHLFMRLYHMGYKIVWADDAFVHEWIPKYRTNIKWVLLRGYRTWSTHSFCEKEFEPSMQVQTVRMAKGSGLILYGIFLLLLSIIWSRHMFIKALLHICRGAGTFSGLLGRQYQEYKTVDSV